MPHAAVDGVRLYYEEVGAGLPLVFVHEFAGDCTSWQPQVRFFARRYRTVAFNARGYPPSDVPEDVSAYSQQQAVEDVKGLLDRLAISRAHVCGLSMGGYAALHFGLSYPDRALSLTVAGCGYGSGSGREQFRQEQAEVARRLETQGMAAVAALYARGPRRVQFMAKDPQGWQEFRDRLAAGSALGHALTLRGVQMTRPSVFELESRLTALEVPTLIVTGDEDEPCLEPGLFLKRHIPRAGLVVLPNSGHVINLEEPDAFNRVLLDFLSAVDANRWPRRHPGSQTQTTVLPEEAAARPRTS